MHVEISLRPLDKNGYYIYIKNGGKDVKLGQSKLIVINLGPLSRDATFSVVMLGKYKGL